MVDAYEIIENSEVKKEFSEAFQKLDRIELIQLLSDLKYLPFKAFKDNFVDDDELASAIARFRKEYQEALEYPEASNIDDIRLASEAIDAKVGTLTELSRRELFVLKEIVGLDNELIIHEIEIDACTLLSRVILYRFRVYDIHKGVVPNQRVTDAVIKKLQASTKEIGFTQGWLALGNLLANQEALSDFCLTSTVLSNDIFGHCIFIELLSDDGKELIHKLNDAIDKRGLFTRNIDSKSVRRQIRKLDKQKNADIKIAQVHTHIEKLPNKFMRRVLQVKLWIVGLYQGKLDHDFGPLSTTALVEYIQTVTENDEKEINRVLYTLGNYQCTINIRRLLVEHFIPVEKTSIDENHSSVSQIYDFVLEDKAHIRTTRLDMKEQIKKDRKKLRKTLEVDLRNESDMIINETRRKVRQYKAKRGILKFFSRLFKFVKDIVKKIIELFKKLFNVIKKSIKIIYSEIKEAFQSFRYGIEFLFGNRVIKPTTAITTDYDFDFDGITRIHRKPTIEEIQTHTTEIKKYASALYPTLNFVRVVITWGIRIASGIGWVQILVGIAKLFKEMLWKKNTLQPA
jgi:hypothetical protein